MARNSVSGLSTRSSRYVQRSNAARKAKFDINRNWYMKVTKPVVTQAAKLAAIRVRAKNEQKMTNFSNQNVQLYHDGSLSSLGGVRLVLNNMLATTQGVTQYNRVGDAIYSQKVNVKLWLSNKLDRPNVMYRIIVLAGELADMPDGNGPTGVALSDIFYNAGAITTMTGYLNRDKFKVIRDQYVQPFGGDYSLEASSDKKEHSRMFEFSIPVNKVIRYKTDNGTVPEGANCYGLAICAYDAYGSLLTDNIASFAYSVQHLYKDP